MPVLGHSVTLETSEMGGAVGYGAEAQAYIDAIETAGASPTDNEKDAIDTFFTTIGDDKSLLKSVFLTCWGAAAPNAVELQGGTGGTWSGAVTHASGYAEGDGSTGYLDTNVSANDVMTLADASYCHYTSSAWANNGRIWGARIGASTDWSGIDPISATTLEVYHCRTSGDGNLVVSGASADTIGLVMYNRKSGSHEIVEKKSSGITQLVTETEADGGTITTQNCTLMAFNNGGSVISHSDRRISFFEMGLGHTSAQRTTLLDALYTMLNSFDTHKPTMV